MIKQLLAAMAVCTAVVAPVPASAQVAPAAIAGGTAGAFLEGLRDTIKQLENSAQDLLAHGNAVAAQQQMLLAGILSSTIDQVAGVYADSLSKTFASLSVTEQNTFTALKEQVDQLEGIEEDVNKDISERIYQTQGAANQILDRLPFTSTFPIFYGVTVGDLSPQNGEQPSDVELLGFHLSDPNLNGKPPLVMVASEAIPDAALSVRQDRVAIQVPAALKEKLGIENTSCNPRHTFPIAMTVFYTEKQGRWIFQRTIEKNMTFNANALPGVESYDITLRYKGEKAVTTWEDKSFRTDPQYRNMGCEANTSASDQIALPAGASEIQCKAQWVDTSNVGSQSATCAVGGTRVTATASMRGRDRDCVGGGLLPRVCNCPGGGHGSLVLSGSYKLPKIGTENVESSPRQYGARAPLNFSAALGIDPALRSVTVDADIARHACAEPLDHILVQTVVPEMRYQQTSDGGRFEAVLQNGQIAINEKP